jgi:hypothetical protein
MNIGDEHRKRLKIFSQYNKESIRRFLKFAGIYMAGVITLPIWLFVWLWVEVKIVGERTECSALTRSGYWEEVMRSYRDRSKTDHQTNWRGINPLNPETYTVFKDPSATPYSIVLRGPQGDEARALVYDDCSVDWIVLSAADRAAEERRQDESRNPAAGLKPQSAPAPQPAPHR